MNRYKMKHGTTISDIEKYAKENKMIFNTGGEWISKDSEHCLFVMLTETINVEIAFPNDLEKWDDFKHTLVMHDDIGQPYGPFYSYLKNPKEELDPYLKRIIEKYNERMECLPFLEKTT